MTLIVGILCSDGVVVASDSAATLSQGATPTIGQQAVSKIHPLGDDLLYASSGAIGMSQLIQDSLARMCSVKGHHKAQSPADLMGLISSKIADQAKPLYESAARAVPLVGAQAAGASVLVRSLVATPLQKKARLFQFDHHGAPEEASKELPFVALGSGQVIADPFLALLRRVLWHDVEPTVAEGRFVAAWTIVHVSTTNFGGVDLPLQMATLTVQDGAGRIEFIADPSEHYDAINAAEQSLRDHVRPALATEVPTPPPPPAP